MTDRAEAAATLPNLVAAAKGTRYLAHLTRDLRALGLPEPEREVTFHPTRKWRLDLAWPDSRVACEYDGGLFTGEASHTSVKGLLRDQEKANEAQLAGWILLRVSAKTVVSGEAVRWIARALEARGGANVTTRPGTPVRPSEDAMAGKGPSRANGGLRRKVIG